MYVRCKANHKANTVVKLEVKGLIQDEMRMVMFVPTGTSISPSKRSTAGGQTIVSGSLIVSISIGTLVFTEYSLQGAHAYYP